MSNYAQQGAQTGIQAPAQGSANYYATSPTDQKQTDLAVMLVALAEMHRVVSELHGMADRACGMNGEDRKAGPTPVPDGKIGEVAQEMHLLRERLYSLNARLGRIA
jgi:hypothetical protein